jgi:hypothetical protein
MRKTGWSIAIAVVTAGACGSQVDSKVVEARKAPCSTLCDRMAECPGELPTSAFATRDECFRECTESDGSFAAWWAYQKEAGEDACFEPFVEKIACETSLSCEDRRAETSTTISESQCGNLSVTAWKCAQQYKDGGE